MTPTPAPAFPARHRVYQSWNVLQTHPFGQARATVARDPPAVRALVPTGPPRPYYER